MDALQAYMYVSSTYKALMSVKAVSLKLIRVVMSFANVLQKYTADTMPYETLIKYSTRNL